MQPKCRKLIKNVIFRTCIYIIYGLIGAIMFVVLEQKQVSNSSRSAQLLNQLHKRIELNCGNMSVTDFSNFAKAAHEAVNLKSKADWNYIYAVNFVYQATTTIGYGDITPVTPAGQAFCILFCLIGIPLILAVLKTTGELLSFCYCRLIQLWEKAVFGHAVHVIKNLETKCAIVAFIVMLLYLVLFAAVLILVDNLSVVKSLYTSFVTFTTIGFGDYIPFNNFRLQAISGGTRGAVIVTVASILATFPGILGLGIVSGVFNSLLSAIYANRKKKRSQSSCLKRLRRDNISLEVRFLETKSKERLLLYEKITSGSGCAKANNLRVRRNSI